VAAQRIANTKKGGTPDIVLVLVVTGTHRWKRNPGVISGDELDRSAFSQEASTTPSAHWLRR
jgi:hypothetical protein